MRSHIHKIEEFISDELETRQTSFLPGPDKQEDGYIGSAAKALESVQSVSKVQADLINALKEARSLMPLGTKVRAEWMERAGKAISEAEGR